MTLDVEGIVCGGLDVEKALRGARRFEPLLFPLSLSDRLVGILRPIVLTLIVNVFRPQPEGLNGDVIGPEFIGCDPGWRCALFLQQFSPFSAIDPRKVGDIPELLAINHGVEHLLCIGKAEALDGFKQLGHGEVIDTINVACSQGHYADWMHG